MTAVKNSVNNAVSVNAKLTGSIGNRKTMTSLKEIEADLESNASSTEDMECYSPKSVVVKKLSAMMMMKEVNVSGRSRGGVVHNPILRIRSEDSLIGEDMGEGLISKFDRGGDVTMFSRPASPLGGKTIKSQH